MDVFHGKGKGKKGEARERRWETRQSHCAVEMAQLGMCLLSKRHDLNFSLFIHAKSWVWWRLLGIQCWGGRDGKLSGACRPSSQAYGEPQIPIQDTVSTTQGGFLRNDTQG